MFDLDELMASLRVEQLDDLLFRGNSLPLKLPQVYGGQVMAQSLYAAACTVEADRLPHSLHGFFLRRGDVTRPIIFDVDPIRDGGSFTTRRVVAKQNGKAIFNCAVSFQKLEEGLEHQFDMPEGIPLPEELERDVDRFERYLNEHPERPIPFQIPVDVIDIRAVNPRNPHDPQAGEMEQGFWFKMVPRLDDQLIDHLTLLTYISDLGFMGTALRAHPVNFMVKGFQGASLDHAMWFHTQCRVDEWLYYHMDSPRSAHARGFNRGSIYSRDGVLVASTAQEGLMRLRK
ncbi:acyl-CoA thioesterase II [Pseudomaricurvus alkylphenolicus]|nr:acyl-CoA thioesterase II [Pseudomaricurvus alkylphenolicus]